MAKHTPVCESGPKWLKENATKFWTRIGLAGPRKDVLAPLTGQDYAAYRTFIHALELYCYSDGDGREHALLCMRYAALAMQQHTRWIARETIPHLLDWGDRETLWPKILAATPELSAEELWGDDKPAPVEAHDVGGAL